MPSVLDGRALVLNAAWMPICTTTIKQALVLTYKGHARVVCPQTYEAYTFDAWLQQPAVDKEQCVRTTTNDIKIPLVVQLVFYSKMPPHTVPFTRRNLFKRDNFTCQYCGIVPGTSNLSIDHIVPRSRGGHTNWKNCVVACKSCNARKDNYNLDEVGMKLLRPAFAPKPGKFFPEVKKLHPQWKQFLGS